MWRHSWDKSLIFIVQFEISATERWVRSNIIIIVSQSCLPFSFPPPSCFTISLFIVYFLVSSYFLSNSLRHSCLSLFSLSLSLSRVLPLFHHGLHLSLFLSLILFLLFYLQNIVDSFELNKHSKHGKYFWPPFPSNCVTHLYERSEMIIFESVLATFEASINFLR